MISWADERAERMTTQINFRLCCCQVNRNLPSLRRELSTSQLKKHYDILNVNSKSTLKEIKDSFLKLSKVYHPDNRLTGSHNKFLELKEAYDALKNGPPATTSDTNKPRYYSSSSYSNYDDYTNLRYNGNAYHRSEDAPRPPFGGAFYNSKSPWEDYKRAQKGQQRYDSWRYGNHGTRNPVSFTLTLSAVAWIIIFSCVSLLWDARFQQGREKSREYQERYLRELKKIENIEADIRRRAMVKRAQRSKYYPSSSENASTSNTDTSSGQQRSQDSSIHDLTETPTFAINK